MYIHMHIIVRIFFFFFFAASFKLFGCELPEYGGQPKYVGAV